jgi:hypothetical protein
MNAQPGMNLNKAIYVANSLGAMIECVRRTGELRFRHPWLEKPCRVDGHRKDAPRHLCVWLRKLIGLHSE